MTAFIVNITDQSHLDGITVARQKYNESQPTTITDEEGNEVPNPALIATDDDYVQFVMSKAAESYANQYGT